MFGRGQTTPLFFIPFFIYLGISQQQQKAWWRFPIFSVSCLVFSSSELFSGFCGLKLVSVTSKIGAIGSCLLYLDDVDARDKMLIDRHGAR